MSRGASGSPPVMARARPRRPKGPAGQGTIRRSLVGTGSGPRCSRTRPCSRPVRLSGRLRWILRMVLSRAIPYGLESDLPIPETLRWLHRCPRHLLGIRRRGDHPARVGSGIQPKRRLTNCLVGDCREHRPDGELRRAPTLELASHLWRSGTPLHPRLVVGQCLAGREVHQHLTPA